MPRLAGSSFRANWMASAPGEKYGGKMASANIETTLASNTRSCAGSAHSAGISGGTWSRAAKAPRVMNAYDAM